MHICCLEPAQRPLYYKWITLSCIDHCRNTGTEGTDICESECEHPLKQMQAHCRDTSMHWAVLGRRYGLTSLLFEPCGSCAACSNSKKTG